MHDSCGLHIDPRRVPRVAVAVAVALSFVLHVDLIMMAKNDMLRWSRKVYSSLTRAEEAFFHHLNKLFNIGHDYLLCDSEKV